jgi:hypothetical protein
MSDNVKPEAAAEIPTKEYTRTDIMQAIEPAIKKALQDMGLAFGSMSPDHLRRTVRALFHIAARACIDVGVPPQPFIGQAMEAYSKETGASSPDELVAILKANQAKGSGESN